MNSSIPQSNRFDLIVCSQELKKKIKERIDILKLSLYRLCAQLELDYKKTQLWMNLSDPTNSNQRLKQWQVIQLAESLGIDIRITIVMKPLETAYANPYDPKETDYGQSK